MSFDRCQEYAKTRLKIFFKDVDDLPEVIKRINQSHPHDAANLIMDLQLHIKHRAAAVFGVEVCDIEKSA